jgi:cytochrome c556
MSAKRLAPQGQRRTVAWFVGSVAVGALAATLANTPTTRSQARVPGLTGVDHPDDVVMARQLLMDGVDENMQAIDLYGAGTDAPLADLKARADRISTLLSIFPHLFPPQTKPSDQLSTPTTATPAIWENFDAFYAMAQAAAMTAFDASKTDTTPAKFKELGTQLRAACDGCHAKYMHVEGPSKP